MKIRSILILIAASVLSWGCRSNSGWTQIPPPPHAQYDAPVYESKVWMNPELLRTLYAQVASGEITSERAVEIADQQLAQAKAESLALSYSTAPKSQRFEPPPIAPFTPAPQYVPQQQYNDSFLQGFAAGGQIAAQAQAQRAARASHESALASHQAALAAENQARSELFKLGMESRGWQQVKESELKDFLEKLKASKAQP